MTKNVTLQNINNLKNTITSKFKEKMRDKKYLEVKRKLRYYKEVINPNLEDGKYLYALISWKKKINTAKRIKKSHELHSKDLLALYKSMSIEEGFHFLLECTNPHSFAIFTSLLQICYYSNLCCFFLIFLIIEKFQRSRSTEQFLAFHAHVSYS